MREVVANIEKHLKQYDQNTQERLIKGLWSTSMNEGGLDSWKNYCGPDYPGDFVVIGTNRDADLIQTSNFESIKAHFEEKGLPHEVHRFGHWACGWFELLMVNVEHKEACMEALEIKDALEAYPVFSDDDYSERQYEMYQDHAEYHHKDLSAGLALHFNLEDNEQLQSLSYSLLMEVQFQNGEDASLSIGDYREPDDYDLRDLKYTLESLNFESNGHKDVIEYLLAAIGAD